MPELLPPSQIKDCEACGEEIAEGDERECSTCGAEVHSECIVLCDCRCGEMGCKKCFITDDQCYWFAIEECKAKWEAEE